MAIYDSNPERRNLVITSLCFVIYYMADGQFDDTNNIKLHVINVSFNNTEFLRYFALFMLFWFLFRYWQASRGTFKNNFKKELESLHTLPSVARILKKMILHNHRKHKDSIDQLDQIHRVSLIYGSNKWKIRYNYRIRTTEDQKNSTYDLDDLKIKFGLYLIKFIAIFKQPTFVSYFTPYFIFAWASFLVIKNSCFNNTRYADTFIKSLPESAQQLQKSLDIFSEFFL